MFDKGMVDAKKHALEMAPEESCGLIVKYNNYIRCNNIAEDKLHNFKIDTDSYLQIDYDQGIKCVIHSHYDFPHLSKNDMEKQIASAKTWGVISTLNNTIQDIFFVGGGIPKEPLVGRHFVSGLWDCYSLARDGYKELYDFILPNIPRNDDYWKTADDEALFEEQLGCMIPEHLKIVDKNDGLQDGDGLLFKLGKTSMVNHCGLYVGRGLMLHHNEGFLSRTEPVGPWFHKIDTVVRPVKLGGV